MLFFYNEGRDSSLDYNHKDTVFANLVLHRKIKNGQFENTGLSVFRNMKNNSLSQFLQSKTQISVIHNYKMVNHF